MRRAYFALSIWLMLSSFPLHAFANEGTIEYDTSVAGQIVPTTETLVRVREETLTLHFRKIKADDDFLTGGDFPWLDNLRVEVAASYILENPSDRQANLHLAFPIVRSGWEEEVMKHYQKNTPEPHPDHHRGVRCAVFLAGQSLPFVYRSFESLFENKRHQWVAEIKAWVSNWPNAAKELEDLQQLLLDQRAQPVPSESPPSDPDERISGWQTVWFGMTSITYWLENATPAEAQRRRQKTLNEMKYSRLWASRLGGFNKESAFRLVKKEAKRDPWVENWSLASLAYLQQAIHPLGTGDIGDFLERWGVEQSYLDVKTGELRPITPMTLMESRIWDWPRLARRIDFLEYHASIPPGTPTELRVEYSHILDVAAWESAIWDSWDANPQFQYILRTSKRWKHFGPIHVRIFIPNEYTFHATPGLVLHQREKGPTETLYTCELDGGTIQDNILLVFLEQGPQPEKPETK